ncbi:MAG TPA: hypothetical protein DEQ09_09970 [Bacteroidales bacterium]|nr:hypothetical protein [Bacteroidales bacterium]
MCFTVNVNIIKEELNKILEPYPDDALKAHTIGPLINNTGVNKNRPELIKPCNYPDQSTLF